MDPYEWYEHNKLELDKAKDYDEFKAALTKSFESGDFGVDATKDVLVRVLVDVGYEPGERETSAIMRDFFNSISGYDNKELKEIVYRQGSTETRVRFDVEDEEGSL